jgi:ribosomal-protein-alanine N-acetyltransferase
MMKKNTAEKIMDDQDMSRIVRQMDESDIDRIMEIEKRSFVTPWSRTMFEEIIFSPTSRGLVIERNNSIVGYTVFYTVDVEAHVMNLAVNPMERKQGYARQLMTNALIFFVEKGISECYLEVREHNRDAQKLYEHFGFEVIGRRKNYYQETNEDALVMQLLL